MPKLLLVSDADPSQTNGVVRTWNHSKNELEKRGYEVSCHFPSRYKNIYSLPNYKEIKICFPWDWLNPALADSIISEESPDYIHIATEGPLGVSVRRHLIKNKIPFTTSYHTRFPEYLNAYAKIPLALSYSYMKWFHESSSNVLVPTASMKDVLEEKGFSNVKVWQRGVDTSFFKPYPRNKDKYPSEGYLFLYVGRLSPEKGLNDFLSISIPGTKYVAGDGPLFNKLKKQYPKVKFLGKITGENLPELYSQADVFVFPSKSDTFGNVMLEAIACGVPVAAYPVIGPKDLLNESIGGMDDNLTSAVYKALKCNRKNCIKFSMSRTWSLATEQLLSNLVHVGSK